MMRKTAIVFWISSMMITPMMTAPVIQPPPELRVSLIEIFDIYGDRTTLFSHGGVIYFACKPPDGFGPDDVIEVALDETGPAIGSAKCSTANADGIVFVRVNITKSMSFGNYKCRFKGRMSTDSINVAYRTCSADECKSANCADGQFCTINKDKGKTCGKIDPNLCPRILFSTMVCPIGAQSLCGAVSQDYAKAWAEMEGIACGNDGELPKLYVDKVTTPVPITEPIHATNDTVLKFVFQNNDALVDSTFIFTITNRIAEVVYNDSELIRENSGIIYRKLKNMPEVFSNGSRDLKMTGKFEKADEILAKTSAIFVVMQTTPVITRISDGRYTKGLKAHWRLPENFRVEEVAWFDEDGNKIGSGLEAAISKSGKYKLSCKVVYSSCCPFKSFWNESHTWSEIMYVKPARTRTVRPPTNGTGTAYESGTTLQTNGTGGDTGPPFLKQPK